MKIEWKSTPSNVPIQVSFICFYSFIYPFIYLDTSTDNLSGKNMFNNRKLKLNVLAIRQEFTTRKQNTIVQNHAKTYLDM